MASFSHLVDIYSLYNYSGYLSGCLEVYAKKNGSPSKKSDVNDDRNIIYLDSNQHKFPMIKGQLVCSKCTTPSLYIRDTAKGALCPKCFYDDDRMCPSCNLKVGCDSCGGAPKYMIQVERDYGQLLLCGKDRCLLPFGLCFKPPVKCTCVQDAKLAAINILGMDVGGVVKSWLPRMKYEDTVARSTHNLTNLTCTQSNKCCPCQLKQKLEFIEDYSIVRGSREVCGCGEPISSPFFQTPSSQRCILSDVSSDTTTPELSEVEC